MMLSTAEIAMIAHETNKSYCKTLGDFSQLSWEYCPQWQRNSAMNGVIAIERKVVTKPEQSHENWLSEKDKDGWVWGAEKDPDKKLHPCMVPFDELPAEQRMKDHLFFSIVTTLLGR